MDENENQNLDAEYKRYLEILRPYLGQLLDQDVIEICNAWIQRLSHCKPNEKILRNKYIFSLCYQLAKGILDEPFLKYPTSEELSTLPSAANTDESVNESSEVEYIALDLENANTKVLYNNQANHSKNLSNSSELYTDRSNKDYKNEDESKTCTILNKKSQLNNKETLCYVCPNIFPEYNNMKIYSNDYEKRAHSLVAKLREIKMQNLVLHRELSTLKEESKQKYESDGSLESIVKRDNAISAHIHTQDSDIIHSLKLKLQEIQESRSSLIESINILQNTLDNFNDMKKHEIENVHAQHKLEIMQFKASAQEESQAKYDKNVEELKQQHEKVYKDIHTKHLKEIETLNLNTEALITEKDKIIQSKEAEIIQLKNHIEELKNNQYAIFNKFLNQPENNVGLKCIKQTAEEFERRLNKVEKSKLKSSKVYEAKLANLQREKHLAECALQLQLIKQRAQVINETADEHQTELVTVVDKLESKYKDIVANVQATAVQRRIQDQMALESIIQTVCGARDVHLHNNSEQATYTNQLPNKARRNQTRDANQSCDNELPTLFRDNKVGSVIVGNKSFGNESVVNGYCLDGEKFGELFERVCIPQRDTGEASPKQ